MHHALSRALAAILAAALVAIAPGCGALPRKKAVPPGAEGRAFVPGLDPGVRTWGGASNPDFSRLLVASVERERAELARQGFARKLPRADFFAISGGGADGAFGAGMLCAWTDLGTRPEFKAVTGISTGALAAPFVFAGPEYDAVLRELYTGTCTEDVLVERGLIGGFLSDAMADTEPLWRLLSKHVDGGAMTQVFLYPASLRLREQAGAEGIVRERRAYIIRNARLDPDWSQVDRRILSIAGRAISALIATQGLGDLYRLCLDCQRDGVDYNVAYIPSDFDVTAREAFDPTYMKALFELGYELTRNGSPWHKFPPGFEAPIDMPSATP